MEPLDPLATANTLTYIHVPEAKCMNDTETGFLVDLNPESENLVLYFQEGGACYDTACNAYNLDGYNADKLEDTRSAYFTDGILSRTEEGNPVKDWNIVFFPYCSGDIFSGNIDSQPATGGRKHVGYNNVSYFLNKVAPHFIDAEHILVTGSSAGGLGSLINFDRIAQTFTDSQLSFLDDSAMPLSDTYMPISFQQNVRNVWNMNPSLPPDCDTCQNSDGGGLANIATFLADKYPDVNFGIVASEFDGVMSFFYDIPANQYNEGFEEMRDTILGPKDNFKVFTVPGGGHVYTVSPLSGTTSDGVTLQNWYTQLLNDDNAWTDIVPSM